MLWLMNSAEKGIKVFGTGQIILQYTTLCSSRLHAAKRTKDVIHALDFIFFFLLRGGSFPKRHSWSLGEIKNNVGFLPSKIPTERKREWPRTRGMRKFSFKYYTVHLYLGVWKILPHPELFTRFSLVEWLPVPPVRSNITWLICVFRDGRKGPRQSWRPYRFKTVKFFP